MPDNQGWVKIHRKLLENPICSNPQWAWVWVCLLLQANHEPMGFVWNGKPITIKQGQFLTGRKKLSQLCHVSETTLERILTYLENGHQIGQQKTSKFRIISIVNWSKYQEEWTSKRTTDGQQTDTNKNDKNDKKINTMQPKTVALSVSPKKKGKKDPNRPIPSWEKYLELMDNHSARHVNIVAHYFREKGLFFETYGKADTAIRRHLRAAKSLAPFSDAEILKATEQAKKEYPELWTIETLTKLVTR